MDAAQGSLLKPYGLSWRVTRFHTSNILDCATRRYARLFDFRYNALRVEDGEETVLGTGGAERAAMYRGSAWPP
jgi:hypothetical protein